MKRNNKNPKVITLLNLDTNYNFKCKTCPENNFSVGFFEALSMVK